MALRIERRDGTDERSVLIGMLVSRRVLGAIAAKWEPNLFAARWSNIIAGWAIDHYGKYHTAPKNTVENYFARWAETSGDKDSVKLVEAFLGSLSDEYERLKRTTNPEFLIDTAARLFTRVRINQLIESMQADLEEGNVEKAQERIEKHRKVEMGRGAGILVDEDMEAMEAALDQTLQEPLVDYPGALGNFFGPALLRDSFVSFTAKEKGGKSFFLMDLAIRAYEQDRRVAYFEVGDNSQHQVMRRFCMRVSETPQRPGRYPYPLAIETPNAAPPRDLAEVEHETRTAKTGLELEVVKAAWKKMRDQGQAGRFRLSVSPNHTISVNGIESVLEEWKREGFEPDLIVVDYADILAPIDARVDRRDQINDTWMALRSLSQVYHCLVATATQANAKSYDAHILTRSHFSEDKRKLGQVNGMCGINQTSEEHKLGVFRLNWVFLRDLDYSEKKCAYCAACLAVGNPCVLSTF